MSNYALRLPESLKQAAKRIAAEDDTTMNQFFVVAIAEKISAMEAADFFTKRAALANKKKLIKHGQRYPVARQRLRICFKMWL